ncbi:Uma2 family endonuclease [soil metagenome]
MSRYREAVATAERTFTAEEFLALPENDHTRHCELIGGRIVMDPPRGLHNLVVQNLIVALRGWMEAAPGRGFVNFGQGLHLTDRDVLIPDLLWWADASKVDLSKGIQPLPDLAVEVRSPATWLFDIGVKRRLYEEHGVGELWLVDTDAQAVTVARRSGPGEAIFAEGAELRMGESLISPALPGFELTVEDLFRLP